MITGNNYLNCRLAKLAMCLLWFGLLLPKPGEAAGLPPIITVQPTNTTVLLGDSVTFVVVASSSTTMTYQWRKNATNISNATNSTYTLASVQTSDASSYSVRIVNSAGSTTSSNATLTILSPPQITTQPQDWVVAAGLNASFSVTATGTEPLSYQWSFNGTPIPGATSSTHTITNAQASNAGVYAATVTNTWGTAYSSNALLTVTGPPVGGSGSMACVTATNVATRTWSHTVSSGLNRLLIVGIALADTQESVSSVTCAGTPLTRITSSQSKNTVEMWYLLAPPVGSANIVATWTGNKDMAGWSGTFINVNQTSPIRNSAVTNGTTSTPSITVASAAGDLVVDTLSIDGSAASLTVGAGQTQICQNTTGTANGDCWGASSYEPGAASVTMSWSAGAAKNWDLAAVVLKAAPLQADLTSAVISPATVPAKLNFTNTVSVTNLGPQTASNVVVSDTLPAGLTFVSASGGGVSNNGIVTWTIPSLASTATTNFGLVLKASTVGRFTNAVTTTATTSDPYSANNASLTIIAATNIPPLADNLSVSTPDGTAKSITLTGSDGNNDPLTFTIVTQPTRGVISSFNTNSGLLTYTPNSGYAGADSFTFVVRDGFTSSSPATVSITVTPIPPTITTQPQNQFAVLNQNVSFSVAAFGTAPLGYQWKFNGTTLASATNSVLGLTKVKNADEGNYTVVVTNPVGSITSQVATLTLGVAPGITTQPQSLTVTQGQAALFSTSANGTAPRSYRWSLNGTTISGATNTTLVLTNVQTNQAGSYRVVVSNAYGSATSTVATLTVLALQINGWVALEAYVGPAGDGRGSRPVTFKASDSTTNVLATWILPLTFVTGTNGYGMANYILNNVPTGTAHLSAKTEWHLRKRLAVTFTGRYGIVNFMELDELRGGDLTGDNRVGPEDYSRLAGCWYGSNAASDIDGNGRVDQTDYFILSNHWQQEGDPE